LADSLADLGAVARVNVDPDHVIWPVADLSKQLNQ